MSYSESNLNSSHSLPTIGQIRGLEDIFYNLFTDFHVLYAQKSESSLVKAFKARETPWYKYYARCDELEPLIELLGHQPSTETESRVKKEYYDLISTFRTLKVDLEGLMAQLGQFYDDTSFQVLGKTIPSGSVGSIHTIASWSTNLASLQKPISAISAKHQRPGPVAQLGGSSTFMSPVKKFATSKEGIASTKHGGHPKQEPTNRRRPATLPPNPTEKTFDVPRLENNALNSRPNPPNIYSTSLRNQIQRTMPRADFYSNPLQAPMNSAMDSPATQDSIATLSTKVRRTTPLLKLHVNRSAVPDSRKSSIPAKTLSTQDPVSPVASHTLKHTSLDVIAQQNLASEDCRTSTTMTLSRPMAGAPGSSRTSIKPTTDSSNQPGQPSRNTNCEEIPGREFGGEIGAMMDSLKKLYNSNEDLRKMNAKLEKDKNDVKMERNNIEAELKLMRAELAATMVQKKDYRIFASNLAHALYRKSPNSIVRLGEEIEGKENQRLLYLEPGGTAIEITRQPHSKWTVLLTEVSEKPQQANNSSKRNGSVDGGEIECSTDADIEDSNDEDGEDDEYIDGHFIPVNPPAKRKKGHKQKTTTKNGKDSGTASSKRRKTMAHD